MDTKPTTTAWDAGLPEMATEGLQPFYDELQGHEVDAARELHGGDRKHVSQRTADKRVMLDARRLQNALDTIGRLPDKGESFHIVTWKRFSLWHVVKATLALAKPVTISRLTVATLGFSKDNLDELLQLLDCGDIGRVDFLYSVYFKSNERQSCERLTHELTTRGHRVVAMLTHAKVLLVELTDGRGFTVESSANLRSCASIEQITMTQDADLTAFHRKWIDEILTEAAPRHKGVETLPHLTGKATGPEAAR
jgi:hypothetical protein